MGHPIQTIDLGTFVGKHYLKPNTIKLIRTVQVKIPVPYRVNVPHPLPYPVPVHKPYPVEVPKYIKVKEQVPVYVPVHSGGHQNNGGSGYSASHYPDHSQQEGSQYGGGGYANDHGGEHAAATTVSADYQPHYSPQIHNDQSGINNAGYAYYTQHQQRDGNDEFKPSAQDHEQYHHQEPSDAGQEPMSDDSHHQYEQQNTNDGHAEAYYQQQQNDEQHQHPHQPHHYEQGEHTAYSGKQLIYTNPRLGLAAFALHDGHGNKGYHLEQDQESDDGSSHSRVYKSEKMISGSRTSGEPGKRGYYSKNYNNQVHEVREVHEKDSE